MEIYKKNTEVFTKKLENKWQKTILLSILGGFFIGIGVIAYICAKTYLGIMAGGIVGASLFPIGLLMCVFMGGSIFTSDSLVSLAWLNKRAKLTKIWIHWGIVIFFNFVGVMILAIVTYLAHIYNAGDMKAMLAKIVYVKTDVEWYATFGSAILCNFLVAGALFMANGTTNEFAKAFLVWMSVAIFVFAGFQHVVANLYVFSAGWLQFGDHVTIGTTVYHFDQFDTWFQNLIPALIGNWLSGAIVIPGAYYLLDKWSN